MKIWTVRHPPSFDWIWKIPWEQNNFFFPSEEHKKEWISKMRKLDKESLVYLAELDESMNYCEYFNRTDWNKWEYIRDDFKFEVNWLWCYWSFHSKHSAYKFKVEFEKHFWHFNRFYLHNRYNII